MLRLQSVGRGQQLHDLVPARHTMRATVDCFLKIGDRRQSRLLSLLDDVRIVDDEEPVAHAIRHGPPPAISPSPAAWPLQQLPAREAKRTDSLAQHQVGSKSGLWPQVCRLYAVEYKSCEGVEGFPVSFVCQMLEA